MSDLRKKLIEAGARAFHDPGVEPHDDDRHVAALVLDAFLDCLAENGLEWFELAGWTDNWDDLINALRESDDG